MDFYPLQTTAEASRNMPQTGEYIAHISFNHCRDESGKQEKEYYLFPKNDLDTRNAFIAWCKKEFGYLKYELWFPKK